MCVRMGVLIMADVPAIASSISAEPSLKNYPAKSGKTDRTAR